MAQGSDALQEPSMDELLASIREIIEENTGMSSVDGRKQPPENAGGRSGREEPHVQPRQAGNSSAVSGFNQGNTRPPIQNNSAPPPAHDAMNALAERIGLRKGAIPKQQETSAKPPVNGYPQQQSQPPLQQQRVSSPGEPAPAAETAKAPFRGQSLKPRRAPEMRKDEEDYNKGLRNDVERSAEILLRPYISQWLDEHFRQLFERVLREEIQRFVQALRR